MTGARSWHTRLRAEEGGQMFVLGAIVIPLILLTSTIAIDVGRFINVTIFSSSGGSDGELCNFDEIGTCIAALAE